MARFKAVFLFVRSFSHFHVLIFSMHTTTGPQEEPPTLTALGSSCHRAHSGLPSLLSLLIIGSKKITVVADWIKIPWAYLEVVRHALKCFMLKVGLFYLYMFIYLLRTKKIWKKKLKMFNQSENWLLYSHIIWEILYAKNSSSHWSSDRAVWHLSDNILYFIFISFYFINPISFKYSMS